VAKGEIPCRSHFRVQDPPRPHLRWRENSPSSDEMLVQRIAAGDKLAMQVLFARHRTPIYRWLLRFVGNEMVAEDLLSDVTGR
jgi:hypothetical protein